ncbi:MAG: hypothetical protein WCB14_12350, partial [Candidatus Acidiferrales bacterium]
MDRDQETPMHAPDRRSFLAYFSGLGLSSTLFPGVLWAKLATQTSSSQSSKPQPPATVTKSMLREAAAVAGLSFTDSQLDRMLEGVNKLLPVYDDLRKEQLDNSVAPALYFNPILPGIKIDRTKRAMRSSTPEPINRPKNLEDAAYWPVTQLAELIRTKQVTSVELTEMYLARLKRLNPKLLCAVTITED